VNKATRGLFAEADTPAEDAGSGRGGLIEHIRTIGLFRNKAKNVMKLSRILVEEYGGEVPSSRAALESLPGVGRKTANVVLNMWFRQPPRRSTRISFGSPTAPASRRARMSLPSSVASRTACRPSSSSMRITG
jgi:hypothetical protein